MKTVGSPLKSPLSMNDETTHEPPQGEDARIIFLPRDQWIDNSDHPIVGFLRTFDDRRIPIRVDPDVIEECRAEEIEPMIRNGLSALHPFDVDSDGAWIRRIPKGDDEHVQLKINVYGVTVAIERE